MSLDKKIQNRLKSKVVWSTLAATALMIAGEIGLYEKIGIEKQSIQSVIDFVLLAFTTFGIFNDPTSTESF